VSLLVGNVLRKKKIRNNKSDKKKIKKIKKNEKNERK
jgi:hypothetical protein